MQELYDIYFSGQIMKGQDPAEVRRKVGATFKLEGSKLELLFSGKPVALKKAVDMDQAVKYRLAFREAGALVDIRPAGMANDVPVHNPAKRSPDMQSPASTRQPAESATEGLSLSPPQGFDLSDCTQTPEPAQIPDISNLSLDQPGIQLDTQEPPSPLQIDTESLQLAEVGPLPEAEAAPAAAIDTSDLTLSPPREGSLEDYQQPAVAAPIPDIDHLSLAEPESQEGLNKGPGGKASFHLPED